MCDVDYGLEEVAVGRSAFQSSTSGTAEADYAVDNNYLTVSCTRAADYSAWLAIDIDQPSRVRAVTVTNDRDRRFRKFPYC